MMNFADIKMSNNTLNRKQFLQLKWATTLAILGIPVLAQILGAMMMFSEIIPILMSKSALLVFGFAGLLIFFSGLYVCLNRLHLRFLGLNRGLDEWEKAMQMKAKAFSYQVIFFGVLVLLVIMSIFGFAGVFGLLSEAGIWAGSSFDLNITAAAVVVVVLFYIIMFLPTLHMVWNIKPLPTED